MANFEGTTDDGWHVDSGTTHHLTNNMENMYLKEEFKDTEQLIIRNGQDLSMAHIGHAFPSFKAYNNSSMYTTLKLKDMLLVHLITMNLLSISKLNSDNPPFLNYIEIFAL